MRMATTADAATATITPIDAGNALVVWDTEGGTEEWLPHPAPELRAGRRLAVVEAFGARHIDVACATPASFCTTSYGFARAMGLRFLALEPGTPLRLVRESARALALAAQPELAVSWLAAPATVPATATAHSPLPDHAVRAVMNRLKRLEGQARGVQRLVEEQRGYDEILPQLAAMRAALGAIGLTLLSEQLAAGLATADEPAGAQRVEAAKRAFLRLG